MSRTGIQSQSAFDVALDPGSAYGLVGSRDGLGFPAEFYGVMGVLGSVSYILGVFLPLQPPGVLGPGISPMGPPGLPAVRTLGMQTWVFMELLSESW